MIEILLMLTINARVVTLVRGSMRHVSVRKRNTIHYMDHFLIRMGINEIFVNIKYNYISKYAVCGFVLLSICYWKIQTDAQKERDKM